VQRELFRLVRKANSYVADFRPPKDTEKKLFPEAAKSDKVKRFVNPSWALELELQPGNKLRVWLRNRLDRPQATYTRFEVQFIPDGPFEVIPRLDSDALLPLGTDRDTHQQVVDLKGLKTQGVFAAKQVLTWETAAIKRIDAVSIGGGAEAHSHRTSHKELKPLRPKPKVEEPKEEPGGPGPEKGGSAGGFPGAGAKRPSGGGFPGKEIGIGPDGGPAGPGGGMEVNVEASPNGLVLNRYHEITPQARRIPVAISMIVDQAHLGRVQTAFADSSLRFITTQVILTRYPHTVRPAEAGGQPDEGGEGGVPGPGEPGFSGRPKFGSGMYGGMYPSSGYGSGSGRMGIPKMPYGGSKSGFPPMPGGTGIGLGPDGGPPSPYGGYSGQDSGITAGLGSDDEESNVEVVIYGFVTLYERYPPRPPAPASTESGSNP
jgi:hypothetical protein